MAPSHDEVQSLVAGYALGVLDSDERRLFEAHLEECSECATELESLGAAVHMLARSVPQQTPPAALRERLIAAVRRDVPPSPASNRVLRRSSERRVWLPVAASVMIALGAGIYGSHIHVETRLAALSERAQAADREIAAARREALDARSAMEIMAAPDVVRIDLEGQQMAPSATARALWSRRRGIVFAPTNLPPPPSGRCYQVWLTTAGAAINAGILSNPAAAFSVLATTIKAPGPVGVAVTLERDGGVSAPSGPAVLVGHAPGAL